MTHTSTEQECTAFEAWWQEHGQYCRAGSGEYEKTFAYRAWQAACRAPTMPEEAPVQPPTTDPLKDFQEGQWWVVELDKIANLSSGSTVIVTADMKRAIAVVHHMLRSASYTAPHTGGATAAWLRPVSELLGHISDVLPDNAFDKIDTAKWNAVSALVGATTQGVPNNSNNKSS